MSALGVVARSVLAAVFIFTAVVKLSDANWPTAARSLGLPVSLAYLVAPAELTLGVLLVVGVATGVVSWLALGLLVAFSAVLVVAMRRPIGERPRCACFGVWSQRPVSFWSLLRNAAFSGVAIVSALAA